MNEIIVLDNNTIDKIAAGEVVERPVSIVKELIENSIDAGATIITVEIKDGGLKTIRVTDNGQGIDRSQIRKAFLSHATSKIRDASDLNNLFTLGFRGEALSSIAAVSRVEVTSRTADSLEGIHYVIEGGKEEKYEEVGAPIGTTFIVRDIFYNTLPRLKFLKSATSEGNLIADLCEHMALSMPDISFQFINNGTARFSTSGHGDLKEVIYRIYGKETAANLRYFEHDDASVFMNVKGYLGLPAINRSNRASEIFFINHRYVKSPMISRAVEEGYIEYLMQHKFPFCILDLSFDPAYVDVNVHPTKQEVRISNEKAVSDSLVKAVADCLSSREMLDDAAVDYNSSKYTSALVKDKVHLPESFEQNRIKDTIATNGLSGTDEPGETSDEPKNDLDFEIDFENEDNERSANDSYISTGKTGGTFEPHIKMLSPDEVSPVKEKMDEEFGQVRMQYEQVSIADDDRILTPDTRRKFRIIGQVFKTYWLIEYEDTLMLMDQHAAHEKVNFERFMSRIMSKTEIPSQMIAPPKICSLNNREMQVLTENIEYFNELGFSLDPFGDHEIAIRAIPMDLFGNDPSDLIGEIITDLLDLKRGSTPDSIRNRIATMACKASVKGNNHMSVEEVEELLDEMLTLDNPYNCPHGRPTLITMSKNELDKRFHRIV
ncbi:MAG: DNA mismatch repair endonuclease MutL [Lachnospiraceae bacterium]|nr:DNA mismatch repair endonuclease MutL [Lachnospiraceae bacterium]